MKPERDRGVALVEELARFLAAQPTATTTLLAQHVDDGSGHCRTCRIGNQRGFLVWPCTLHAAAARASATARAHEAEAERSATTGHRRR